jgi:hypothetical protein
MVPVTLMVVADWRRGLGITIEYSGFGGDA